MALKNRKVIGGITASIGIALILVSLGIIQLFSIGAGGGATIQEFGEWDRVTVNSGFYNADSIRMGVDGMLPQCRDVTTKYGRCGWRASGVATNYGFIQVSLICDIPLDQFDAKFPAACPDFDDGTLAGIESYLTQVMKNSGYVSTGFVWAVPRYTPPVVNVTENTTIPVTNPPANVSTNTTRTIDTVTQTPAGPIQNGYVFGFGASMVLAGMAIAFVRIRR